MVMPEVTSPEALEGANNKRWLDADSLGCSAAREGIPAMLQEVWYW